MSHITLIRHGQANTNARDEAEYDRLSDLGHQQAAWLGDHLRATGSHHPRCFCGTLTRHIETARGMAVGDAIRDERLNELEYFTLSQLLQEQHGVDIPQEREGFITHLPKVFTAWESDALEGAPESFRAFETRVSDALREISEGSGAALVVTSGGLIAIALRRLMELNMPATARVALAIMNTSMHRLFPIGAHLSPVLFNAVPHLETPERQFAQTHF
ncbi:histidine phosphatase family protein [Microbulbifer sp. S227A]|uniref:histidine phosphatase family protein n=1 Tax=Microbulbifer sp. S227A TaxID=3415131 RepID=UPI003C7A480A